MHTDHVTVDGLGAVRVHRIDTVDRLGLLAAAIDTADRVAVDTETHDASCFEDGIWSALRVVAVAVATGDGFDTYVVDVRDVPADALAPVLDRIGVADAWNANFDDRVLRLAGCPVAGWRDAMITDALLHAGAEGFGAYHALSTTAKRLLDVDVSGKGSTQTSFDATSDLTAEQVRYAGVDAAVTLAVATALDVHVDRAGLRRVVDLEQRARPFVAAMTEAGIPFDTDGWRQHLRSHETRRDAALAAIAELTVTAEPTLEDLLAGDDETAAGSLRPGFNVDSDPALRAALNEHIPELVAAFCDGRLLGRTDKLDKTTIKSMIQLAERHGDDPAFVKGAALLTAILTYRTHAKILSTYGDGILKYVADDGRLHPKYRQAVVATGRLSSDRPNAQNLSPEMKPFLTPDAGRVLVYADLSQAELRVLAQLAGEGRMVETFAAGGDFHTATAGQMFGVDMAELAVSDPEQFAALRKKAKGISFGLPYGLGASALATNLTVNSGVIVSPSEAKAMLAAYASAFPNVDGWLRERDRTVRSWADNLPVVDWDASFRLLERWQDAEHKRRALRRKLGRWPSGAELVEVVYPDETIRAALSDDPAGVSGVDVDARRAALAAELDWAFRFDAPVALDPAGIPVEFEGRTGSGRRRRYQVPMDSSPSDRFAGVLTAAMLILATTDKPGPAAVRDRFAADHGLDLPSGTHRFPTRRSAGWWETQTQRRAERVRCVKAFDGANKPLKLRFVRHMLDGSSPEAVDWLLTEALAEQLRAQSTKFRNQPIQGLVADIVLDAYGDLWEQVLPRYRSAVPVCSIHDSIVLECDTADAAALAGELQETLEAAMRRWCPDVPAKADCDVRRSFDDASALHPVTV